MGLGLRVLLLALPLPPGCARAADAEDRAFNAAAKAFQSGLTEWAEKGFAEFVQQFPNSPRVPDAILLQARAAFSRTNLPAALSLLSTNLARAGQVADQYWFYLGQMQLESGHLTNAAATFAQFLKDFTNSPRRLEASYGEAQARFRLKDWPRVIELLQRPDGAFQQAARLGGNEEPVARAQLLLGEALLKQNELAAADSVTRRVSTRVVELNWARQFLLCRIQVAGQQFETARQSSTNLLALAAATGQARFQAESLALQGSILEVVKDPAGALAAYEKILAEGMPADQRRDAFLKITELTLAANRLADAVAQLEKFLAAHPEDASSDEVLLTLGELRLKEHLLSLAGANRPGANAAAAPGTNLLQQALAHFEQFIQKFPDSPHLGRAHLHRGWTLWVDGKLVESQAAFQMAADKLPFSEDQAVARFKLGDTFFRQNDLTNALAAYRKIIDDYAGLPRVRTGLFDRAWYQIAGVCMQRGDLAGASDAMRKILVLFPASFHAERSLLLVGQEWNRANQPAEARALCTEFAQRFTNSALLPEVQLALARSYELETNWPAAIRTYDGVLARFPTNDVAPQAEFQRALAEYHAGRDTNALARLTNFLARFPTHELAPHALDWIGDFHFRAEDFAEAERNFQRLYQNTNWWGSTNWPIRELTLRARFKAGRAAVLRQAHTDAIGYFTNLISLNCPLTLLAETFFAYGDVITTQPVPPETTNRLANFALALAVFAKIPQLCAKDPANLPLIARAWGRIADCHLQLAREDARHYESAAEFYQKALGAPQADLATRSQAEVGWGHALAKQAQLKTPPEPALLNAALDHYLNVVYGKSLLADEAPLPFWVKEAGLAAARLLETQKRWTEAISLYTGLQELIPPLKPSLEKRAATAREQLAAGGK